MIRSMTAFARHENKDEFGSVTWELRSINHRYLEILLRLPEEFRPLEAKLREKVTKALGRGKIECILNYKPVASIADQIVVNETLANALIKATHKVETLMNNPARISAIHILQWPGITREPEVNKAPLLTNALDGFNVALNELIAGRQREGIRLGEILRQRCESIHEMVKKVHLRRAVVMQELRNKILARIAELEVEPDTNRLEQELVFIAQKLDVDEELNRLESHCNEVITVLERTEPVGRRLDFLMQELNREANTLGSKAADLPTTQAVVEIKVLIEQMREQAQNIE